MSHAGQTQETASGDSYQETSEWKVPMGILLLKSTYLPRAGVVKPKSVELGFITSEEDLNGKKGYKFCKLANLYYTTTNEHPDSRVDVRWAFEDTLDKTGRYENGDGSKIEYKHLYQQDDMIDFVRKLSFHNSHRLLGILKDQSQVLKINEQNKQLLAKSLEIVINETPARNHNHRN
jgi:hypothetical protein